MGTQPTTVFSFEEQAADAVSSSLLRVFEDIHNHIYANDGLSPEQALEETIKLLFVKMYDEKNDLKQFVISKESFNKLSSGKTDAAFISTFEKLAQNTFAYFDSLFSKDESINLRPSTLAFVVQKLHPIKFLNTSSDVKGLAFQKFLNSSQRVGRGQFFTPEQVVKLCLEILQPKPTDLILDPACGSAGFLAIANQYLRLTDSKKQKKLDNIYGIEISKTASRIANMRMLLEGDVNSNIINTDSLSDWNALNKGLAKSGTKKLKKLEGSFDIVITNPPFGTQGKINNESILENFKLGFRWEQSASGKYKPTRELQQGQVPEILFIERCIDFLKPGGKLAIVLPNGDFENSSLAYLREYICDTADILAVVKLPQETFIPSGTGVKTSVLFLQKKSTSVSPSADVFFGEITKIGFNGNKTASTVYKKSSDGNILKNKNGDLLIDEDISTVIKEFQKFSTSKGEFKASENCFTVSRSEIDSNRFDYEYYRPSYRKTRKLLQKNGAFQLSELVELKKKKSSRLKQKDLLVQYVELSDISTEYNEIINSKEMLVHDLPSRASYDLTEGDIITAVAGNSIGTKSHASAFVTSNYNEAICTNGFRVMRVNESLVNPMYLLYFFRTKIFLDQIFQHRTGAAIPSINDEDLLGTYIILPSLKIQNEIAETLLEGFRERMAFKKKISEFNLLLEEGGSNQTQNKKHTQTEANGNKHTARIETHESR